jgi:proteasome lid subunit RPN8/RPN11
MLDSWNAPGAPVIEFDRQIMEDIRLAAVEGFLRIRHGGVEVGGVLFGTHVDGRIRIVAHRPIECEHIAGPSFTLSPGDEKRLEGLFAGAAADEELQGLEPVGWYHSHTRSDIFLSESDVQIHDRHFRQPWQVALVLRPRGLEPTRAGFFVRNAEGSLQRESSLREFHLEPLPKEQRRKPRVASTGESAPEEQAVPPPVPTPTPSQEPPRVPEICTAIEPLRPALAINFARPNRKLRIARIVAAGVMVASLAAALTTWSRNSHTVTRPSVGLRLVGSTEQMSIEWNTTTDVVRRAQSASLEVDDGGNVQLVPIDVAALRSGRVTYIRQSGNVNVRLTIHTDGGEVGERAYFLGPAPVRPEPIEPPKTVPTPVSLEPVRQTIERKQTPPRRTQLSFDSINNKKPALALLPVDEPPRLEFFHARLQGGTPGAVAWTALPANPPREATPRPVSGRAIWTGLLKRSGLLKIDGSRTSTGFLSGTLPDKNMRVVAYPAELTDVGVFVYVPMQRTPPSEPASAQNGWNQTSYVYDPERSRDVRIMDVGPSMVTVRSDNRNLSMIVFDWKTVD